MFQDSVLAQVEFGVGEGERTTHVEVLGQWEEGSVRGGLGGTGKDGFQVQTTGDQGDGRHL